MKKVCYYVERNDLYNTFLVAFNEMIFTIPCFVSFKDVEMNFVEITVLCREEDILTVQNTFAPFL